MRWWQSSPSCPVILGSCALWSNKSKKCVFIGFLLCLSLITFLCVLASLFYFGGWQRPAAHQPWGLFCWCWAVFVDLWKWLSKTKIMFEVASKCRDKTYGQHSCSCSLPTWFLTKENTLKGFRLFCFLCCLGRDWKMWCLLACFSWPGDQRWQANEPSCNPISDASGSLHDLIF